MWSAIIAAGIPSAITGFVFWLLKRWIDKKDKERDAKETKREQLMMMMIQTIKANNVLATATAKAVQRIPDAKCNGDMTEALKQASDIQAKEKEFLVNEGIKHIFE
jgi:hypothetical protein